MIQERAMELVTALRSGKYQQTSGSLKRVDENGVASFCCLGVACDIYGEGWGESFQRESDRAVSFLGEFAIMPPVVQKHFGFKSKNGTPDEYDCSVGRKLFKTNDASCLAEANDILRWNFNQIADFIEKNWEVL